MLVVQLCRTLCDTKDCSPPGSSVHGIPQARILEYVAISFSRGSFQPGIEPRSSVLQADSLPSEPPGKPFLRNLLFHLFTLQHEPRQDMEKCLIHLSMKMSKVNMDDWEEQRFSLKRQLSSFTKQPNISMQQIEVDLANAGTQFGSPDFFVLLI